MNQKTSVKPSSTGKSWATDLNSYRNCNSNSVNMRSFNPIVAGAGCRRNDFMTELVYQNLAGDMEEWGDDKRLEVGFYRMWQIWENEMKGYDYKFITCLSLAAKKQTVPCYSFWFWPALIFQQTIAGDVDY